MFAHFKENQERFNLQHGMEKPTALAQTTHHHICPNACITHPGKHTPCSALVLLYSSDSPDTVHTQQIRVE